MRGAVLVLLVAGCSDFSLFSQRDPAQGVDSGFDDNEAYTPCLLTVPSGGEIEVDETCAPNKGDAMDAPAR